MQEKTYSIFKYISAVIVFLTALAALMFNQILLALIGVFIGIFILGFARTKTKAPVIDERTYAVGEKAANFTYLVSVSVFGLLALILMITSRNEMFAYFETLGIIFAYITMFMLIVYAIAYFYYSRYGTRDK